jgi:hypothetical protein
MLTGYKRTVPILPGAEEQRWRTQQHSDLQVEKQAGNTPASHSRAATQWCACYQGKQRSVGITFAERKNYTNASYLEQAPVRCATTVGELSIFNLSILVVFLNFVFVALACTPRGQMWLVKFEDFCFSVFSAYFIQSRLFKIGFRCLMKEEGWLGLLTC